jgi:hypothetical protein
MIKKLLSPAPPCFRKLRQYDKNGLKSNVTLFQLLERVVRSQRLGNELATAIKRQSIRVRKPKSVVLAEYDQARALNDRLRYVAETLMKEYPHLADKLEMVLNTLNIHSPEGSPRLTDDGGACSEGSAGGKAPSFDDVAEKPLCP